MSTMMKCGCAAAGVLTSVRGEKLETPIPACVTHGCYDVADAAPNLAGRVAQCSYLPRNHAPRPSNADLAFFVYCGPGSREAEEICKCGMHLVAHHPRWGAYIKVERANYTGETWKEVGAPTLEEATVLIEHEADFFRRQTTGPSRVLSAIVGEIKPRRNEIKCKGFTPRGDLGHDKYYCGCHGWD